MSKVWVFLISIAEYDDKNYNLSFVHGDNACIKHGLMDGLLIADEQIVICGSNCYVKYSDFQFMISLYVNTISSSDRVIIYFSGHGGGAPFSLKFSDTIVNFSMFCNEVDRLPACAKIFIIDSCYSGSGEIPDISTVNPSHNLFDYVRSGYAVFASSNAESSSSKHPEKTVSLYTYCFSRALCNARIRNGRVSLIDVAKCAAFEVDCIARKYGRTLQHPIFRCKIPGDVLIQIKKEKGKEKNIYTSCQKQYDIYSTRILHSSMEMRYSVFAIAKGEIDDVHIAQNTIQIMQEIKLSREFESLNQKRRFKGEYVKVIFVYWGKAEEDIIRRNWIYFSRWADPTSRRENWYRLDKNSQIVSDIWVSKMKNYNMLGDLYRENMICNTALVEHTHTIADFLLKAASEVVRYFEEYDNGNISEKIFIQISAEAFKTIQNCYWQMSDLPIPSVELKEWADGYDCLAASIHDMQLFYTSKTFLDREESNRRVCMRGTVERYRDDLQKLVYIEDELKKLGTF